MDFEAELMATAKRIDEQLAAIIAAIEAETPEPLLSAMRHALLGGGKRLRPFLVIASAAMFGTAESQAMRAAAALECLHCYSLVHDDLPAMDDDALRRGRPTVHVVYGEAAAILAGDALLTLAFEILADPLTFADPLVRAELALDLARAAGSRGMAGGQMLDLSAGLTEPSQAETMRMQHMKTGCLIEHACAAGAILGRAGEPDRDRLRRYGAALGAAFQIADDLLDREASEAELGKATGKDLEAGKATLVDFLGIEGAREHLAALTDEACDSLAPFGERAALLRGAARFVRDRRH